MKNAPDWLARGAESDGRSIWGMNWLVACMVGCSQQSASKAAQAQSAPKSASEASVVEMPAYLDVQANPDKYVGRKVSWIRTETMTLIVDAHGEQVEREFA